MASSQSGLGLAEIVTHYRVRAEHAGGFAADQARLATLLVTTPGYTGSQEYLAHAGSALEWTIVRHFEDAATAAQWLSSPAVVAAQASMARWLAGPPTTNVLVRPGPRPTAASIVITSRVRPGSQAWFVARQGRMQVVQAGFPGYVGQRDQAPIPGINPHWVSVVAFDTAEHLRAWLDSPERGAFLADAGPHVRSYDVRPAASAFESWFAAVESPGNPPPAWKLNMIVLLVLYPVVMAEILWLNPLLSALGLSVSTFLGNVISVAATGFLLIPLASRLLRWWLVPDLARPGTDWRGTMVLVAAYAALVAFFQVLTGALGP